MKPHLELSISHEVELRYAQLQQMALDHARHGDTLLLAEMILHGLPANLSDAKGNSLLMLACYNGNLATAKMLLDRGAEVDRRNDRLQTPLGGAAFKGYDEVVDLLLSRGADIDADNGNGMTPLMFAAMFGRTRVVEQLRAHGASMKRPIRWGASAGLVVQIVKISAPIIRAISTVIRRARQRGIAQPSGA